jgi:hypothetical protein
MKTMTNAKRVKKMPKSQPMQPIYLDELGTPRFKDNAIIRKLVDNEIIDLNKIDTQDFPVADVEQFWQLLGYSTSGYGGLDFVRRKTVAMADEKAVALLDKKKEVLRGGMVRAATRRGRR